MENTTATLLVLASPGTDEHLASAGKLPPGTGANRCHRGTDSECRVRLIKDECLEKEKSSPQG